MRIRETTSPKGMPSLVVDVKEQSHSKIKSHRKKKTIQYLEHCRVRFPVYVIVFCVWVVVVQGLGAGGGTQYEWWHKPSNVKAAFHLIWAASSCLPLHPLPSCSPLPSNRSTGKLRRQQLYDRGECHKTQKAERGSEGSWWVIAPLNVHISSWELGTSHRGGVMECFPQAWTRVALCVYCLPPHCRSMMTPQLLHNLVITPRRNPARVCLKKKKNRPFT